MHGPGVPRLMSQPQYGGGAESKLPIFTKLLYGLGEMAEGVKTATLETFLFFYYVQVVGLSGSLTGLALLIALLVDGVADPLIGDISDRVRTPIGRRHPWLYAAPLPLALFLFLLFTPPQGLGPWPLFGWLICFTVLSRLMQSFYFVPHMALGAELSTDFRERISVSGYRSIFAYIGRLASVAIAFSFFFRATPEFPNGQLNPAAYSPFALVCGLIVIGVILTSALGTQARVRQVMAAGGTNRQAHHGGNFLESLLKAFRIRAFTVYFTAILISYVLGGVQAALQIHLNTYYWRLPPKDIQTVLQFTVFGFMAGVLFARPLASRFDKKPVYVACMVTSVVVVALPILLAEAGLYPVADKGLLVIFLAANTFIASLIGGPAVVVSAAMLADVADLYELRFGGRSEGFLFGASAFTRKASMGVGGAIAGVALDLIHFPKSVPPEDVARADASKLAWLFGPGVLIFVFAAGILMWTYDLTRQKHDEVLRQLADKS